MNNMYTRQETLDLNTDVKVIVCGVGGIGWHFVKGLAMAGVDDIMMFDDDTVELHNLPRLDIPIGFIGKNKATLLKQFIDQMRPDNDVKAFPYKFNDIICGDVSGYDYFIDCSDNHDTQVKNQAFANENNLEYVKIGYNGTHITIARSVAEWDTDEDGSPDGYTIVPSYISPAIIVAGLAINMVLNKDIKEISCDIEDLYIVK